MNLDMFLFSKKKMVGPIANHLTPIHHQCRLLCSPKTLCRLPLCPAQASLHLGLLLPVLLHLGLSPAVAASFS